MSIDIETRIRNVTAVLGPTNTGKTHLAIERMLGHETGLIGLPLRLLAREVYDKVVARVGADKVALITGEEKIKPEAARYWVCTVEAMPPDIQTDFLAIDEIQLAADPERGHVFTDRLLNSRGKLETLLLGAATMRDAIADLIPGANFVTRPRLSKLSYAGEKKITRLPPRSAIVSFSANDVYAIAELVRRQRGGAAVVLGALSPRTRNAQVALFQSGQVDFLIATDAVGMGLNLDVEHVALAQTRKFDGATHRDLTPAELAQIAGRAGRYMRDGTFGVTGGIEPLTPELVERIENHTFDPVKLLQWRARNLDFASVDHLRDSLRRTPREVRLQKARMADDVLALEAASADRGVMDLATNRARVELLWDVCQLPDYRKISTQTHADLVATLYKAIAGPEQSIPTDWIAAQVALCDKTDGDIDTLSQRLAHIRTWTYAANRADWLKDAVHWQERTRAVEDSLSDALHEQLTQRFVDQRTTSLMRGMRDKEELYAEIADDGAVNVEKHYVGRLRGFHFQPETQSEDLQGKAARAAAAHVLTKELAMRARRVSSAKADAFKLNRKGEILWRNDVIARLAKGDTPLKPHVVIEADEQLSAPDKEKVQERLDTWITELIGERLKPLVEIAQAEDVSGLAKGIAFRMSETFGVLRRETAADELKSLDQPSRSSLRRYGVRFGAFNVFFPLLLKPAAAEVALILRVLNGAAGDLTLDKLPEPPKAGLTSIPFDSALPAAYYETLGYQVSGPRAVRIDMLERLADMIRPLLAFRSHDRAGQKVPAGATGDGGFIVTPQMMSILGCSSTELSSVLEALGFVSQRKPLRLAIKQPPPAPVVSASTADPATASPAIEGVADAVTEDGALEASGDAAAEAVAEAPTPDAAVSETATVAAEATPLVEAVAVEGASADAAESAPAPVETASVESAPVESVPVESAPVESVPVEEPMIDVWRPRRRHQQQHAPRHAREGEPRGNFRRDNRRPRNDRRPDQPKGDAVQAVAPVEGVSAERPASDRRDGPPRGDRPERRFDNRPPSAGERRDRPQGPRSGPPRGDRDGRREDRRGDRRGDDKRERGGGGRPPQQFTAGPSRGRGPDPNSPFAALGALKAALEKRDTDDKTAE